MVRKSPVNARPRRLRLRVGSRGVALVLGVMLMLRGITGAATDETAEDNIVVILDASGSMNDPMAGSGRSRMEAAKEALLEVLSGVPRSTHVGVLVLPRGWVYDLGAIDPERLRESVLAPRAKGSTPLGSYLKKGADRLLERRGERHGYGSYRLLVVTDGEATDAAVMNANLPDILSRGITLDVIGVDMEREHSLATRVHSYRSANDPASLKQALSEVLAEIGADSDGGATDESLELVSALPDEIAIAVLEALAKPKNHPIGEKSRLEAAAPPSPPSAPTRRSPAREPSSISADEARPERRLSIGMLVLVGLALLGVGGALITRRRR